MPRETTKITTPISKQTLELKTYLIGREKRALQNVFLSTNLSVSLEGGNMTGIDAKTVEKAQELAWQTVIVSIDESTDANTFVETILNMRGEDYDFVVAEVNKITTEKKS